MAKDILITPADGTLVFSGSASSLSSSFISDASGSLTLYLEKTGNQSFGIEGSGSTLLKVDGTQGRLFSITDEMSGSIFSANTIAGLPVIEAFSDNEVRFGPYSSPVIVDSSGNISGSATSTGSFGRVEATTLTINGTSVEAGADVTDSTNVEAAGALMDSEVDADIKTLSLPASTTISTFGASLIDDAAASNARTTLELGTAATTAASAYATSAQGSTADSALQSADTMYVGTTSIAFNRANAALTLAGITLTTPTIVAAGWINANHTHAGGTTGGTIAASDVSDFDTEVSNNTTVVSAYNSGATRYTHPTNAGDDISIDTTALTGATVISDLDFNVTTDTAGHVTDANGTVATRTLTLANLGYTGHAAATNNTGTVTSVATAGTVSGLTLTGGTITSTGTITLGGTLTLGNLDTGGNAATATTAGTATTVTTTTNPGDSTSHYLTFVNGATGGQDIEVDTSLSFVPSTNTLTVANITGNASTATKATTVTTTQSNSELGNHYLTFVDGASGGRGIRVDTALHFNPSTNLLTAPGVISCTTINTGNGATEIYDMNQDVQNDDAVKFLSLGVNTAPGVTGEIRATNEVTAYYSDDRLKTKSGNIENALDKVISLNGFHYKPNKVAGKLGYDTSVKKVGVSAQEVLKVLPEAVVPAPIDPKYHTVQYEKLIPLLIESIKELTAKVKRLENGDS